MKCRWMTATCVLAALSGLAMADDFSPVAVGSVLDQPRDGVGDVLEATFTGLIREQSTRENRAFQEFDVSSLAGMNVISAQISGRVAVNNSFDNGVRSFQFIIYQGDGAVTLSDFGATGPVVGTGAYHPPNDTFFDFNFDVTAAVSTLISGGATHVGLMADCTSDPSFPNILTGDTVLTIVAEPGGCPADLSGSSDPNDPAYGMPDGIVDAADFFYFLDQFTASNLAVADLSGSADPNDAGYGVPDGTLDASDFFYYLDIFVAGCP